MTKGIKSTLIFLFLLFMLLPGLLHYVQNHEQMRVSLINSTKIIDNLKSEHRKDMVRIENMQGNKLDQINTEDFCLPAA